MKLGLGTVQFGLKYGINNSIGKPNLTTVKAILDYATQSGIRLLDTAADYGDSEEVLGSVLSRSSAFRIITKTSREFGIRESVMSSLNRLRTNQVYGVLVHDFSRFRSTPNEWHELEMLKKQAMTERVGFTLYTPEELELLLEMNLDFDLIQLPYSVFDQRFEPYFERLRRAGVEIHTRSAFLQGLVFKNPASLDQFFYPLRAKLQALCDLAKESGKSIQSLCLNFVCANENVDTVLIGVDTVENLRSNVLALAEGLSIDELSSLRGLREDNELMILPFKWNVK